MKKMVLVLVLFIPLIGIGQNFAKTWQQCYGGTENDDVKSIIPYNDGYLFLGSTYSSDGDVSNSCNEIPNGTAWLVNIDSQGEIIFERSYCGAGGASGKKIMSIDNDFYFIGSSGPNNYGGVNGFWLTKADADFNIQWQDVIGGTYIERPKGGCIAHDGGVIENGITGSPDGDIEEYYGDFDNCIIKMNPDGSRGWIKTYGNIGGESGGNIIPTRDGGYLLASSGYNQLPGNTCCEGDNILVEAWLIKLNAQGGKEWFQCYGGSHIDYFRDVIEVDDGYVMIGSTDSNDGDIINHHGVVAENTDIWVIKTDLSGDIQWSNCFGGSDWEHSYKIFQNDNSTFTVFGVTESHDYDVQGNTNTTNSFVVWMFIIDENGELIFQKPFSEIPQINEFPDFIRVSDYKYIAAITRNTWGCNYSQGNHNSDIYIFEIQDMDEFIPSQAQGNSSVCLSTETETYYSTELVIDTMETQWLLLPEEAGEITVMHDSVLIAWNPNFQDTAWLQVRAVNEYGESAYSTPKEIIVYPPLIIADITGPDSLCSATNTQTIFSTQLTEESQEINWYLLPETAGTIINQQDTAIITWNPIFEGQVYLKTGLLNKCDMEEFSNEKEVRVRTCLGVEKQKGYYLEVYPNPASDRVTFNYKVLSSKDSELNIKSIDGKQVASFQLSGETEQKVWDTRSLKAGTYIFELISGELKQTGKIVIVK